MYFSQKANKYCTELLLVMVLKLEIEGFRNELIQLRNGSMTWSNSQSLS